MIRLINDRIYFEAVPGKQFEVPFEVLKEYIDYQELDEKLKELYVDAVDLKEYAVRNPMVWELVLGWIELTDEDFDFEELMEQEIEAEAKIRVLYPHQVGH